LALNHQTAIVVDRDCHAGVVLRLALNHQTAIVDAFSRPCNSGAFFLFGVEESRVCLLE
jgi:hypothetical protein